MTPLPGLVYPGLLPADGTVTGLTISDLTADEWTVLDAFENPQYDLTQLRLTNGQTAWAYTSPADTTPADGTWDKHTFASQHLTDYVHRCADWHARYTARKEPVSTAE